MQRSLLDCGSWQAGSLRVREGREGRREGGRERGREGGRKGGREGGKEGGWRGRSLTKRLQASTLAITYSEFLDAVISPSLPAISFTLLMKMFGQPSRKRSQWIQSHSSTRLYLRRSCGRMGGGVGCCLQKRTSSSYVSLPSTSGAVLHGPLRMGWAVDTK